VKQEFEIFPQTQQISDRILTDSCKLQTAAIVDAQNFDFISNFFFKTGAF